MPILLLPALFGGGGLIAGFTLGGGADALSNAIKWAAIGGITFVIAKQAKLV